jgi:hypothetical protein
MLESSVGKKKRSIFTAICIGLIPLALYIAVIVCAVLLTIFVSRVSAPTAFLVQRQIDLFGIISGLTLAFIIYAVSALLLVRHIWLWLASSFQAHVILWTLVVTAFLIVLPVILASLVPQHPAP